MANSGDPTSGPSNKVPYYVVAFDSTKTAQEIMEFMKEKSIASNISEEDQRTYYPDGIFVLNPDTGTIVLKDIGLHKLQTNIKVPPFCGGEAKRDSLCTLWFALIAQVEATRFLNFPNKTYINKLFPKPESTH